MLALGRPASYLAIVPRLDTPRAVTALLALASAAALGGAFALQYLGGLAPCVLCVWQRYPYAVVMGLGLVALALGGAGAATGPRFAAGLIALCSAVLAVGSGIALYHVAVEQGWAEPAAGCTGGVAEAESLDDFRSRLMAAPVVRCTDVAWSLFGLSLAAYNAILSSALAALAALAAVAAWRQLSGRREKDVHGGQ